MSDTTGKSIECRVSEWTRFSCSALSVVVNAQADARRRASEEQGVCIQAGDQHRPPHHNYQAANERPFLFPKNNPQQQLINRSFFCRKCWTPKRRLQLNHANATINWMLFDI